LLSRCTAEREEHGAEWCRKWGVGRRRRILNQIVPPNVVPIEALRSPELASSLNEQRDALAIFVAHCRLCPVKDCKLARE